MLMFICDGKGWKGNEKVYIFGQPNKNRNCKLYKELWFGQD